MRAQEGWVLIVLAAGMAMALAAALHFGRKARAHAEALEPLSRLEAFGRALLRSIAGEGELSVALFEHLPRLFPDQNVIVWLFLEDLLYFPQGGAIPDLAALSGWLSATQGVQQVQAREELPWAEGARAEALTLIAPILSVEGETIGGVLQEWRDGGPSREESRELLARVAEYLSAQLGNMASHEQSLELEQVRQELEVASQIQTSFLPTQYPDLPGWQLAVALEPAGELSGDFFDFVQLDEEHVGLLLADVTGKGLGAALFMALCRTLIRTYALEYPGQPEVVFAEVNERLLQDARGAPFVTAFYAILDLKENALSYANAGHHPPYLFGSQSDGEPRPLLITGIPMGIEAGQSWERQRVELKAGETLMIYSDGLTDAQNGEGEAFGSVRLIGTASKLAGESAAELQNGLLSEIRAFTGDTPQFDDMTLLVLRREDAGSSQIKTSQ